jgi:hypothetical protein
VISESEWRGACVCARTHMCDDNGRELEYPEEEEEVVVEGEQLVEANAQSCDDKGKEEDEDRLEPMDIEVDNDPDPQLAFFLSLKALASPAGIPLLCIRKDDARAPTMAMLLECTDAASPAFVMLYGLYFAHAKEEEEEEDEEAIANHHIDITRLMDWLYVARLVEAHATKLPAGGGDATTTTTTMKSIKDACDDYVAKNVEVPPFLIVVQNELGALHAWASGYPYHHTFQLFHALCDVVDKSARECGLSADSVHAKFARLYPAYQARLPAGTWSGPMGEVDKIQSAFDTAMKRMDGEINS